MNKGKLNKSGLMKLIPYLEEIANEVYGDHGGLNLRIGYDGELRMECADPSALIQYAAKEGLTIAYVGKDKFSEACFEIYAPINEQLAIPPGQNVTTPVAQVPQSPTEVGAAAKSRQMEKGQQPGQPADKAQQQQVMAQVMKQVQDQLSQKIDDITKALQGAVGEKPIADVAALQKPSI